MERVNENDELSATKWNRMAEAAERFHRFEERGRATPNVASRFDTGIIKVRNDSGGVRRQGEILEFIGNMLADPVLPGAQQIWLKGGVVTLANSFGVLLESLPEPSDVDTAIGNCQIDGACVALVNITDAAHQYAAPASGLYVLQSGPFGPARILRKPSGTGEKACVVRLEQDGIQVDIVQVHHAVGSPGATVTANGDGLHEGRIRRVVSGVMTTVGSCWILFVDGFDTVAGVVSAVQDEYYGPGRFCGYFTSGAVTLPLYLAKKGSTATATPTGTPFYNDSGEGIPPYAVMWVAGDTRVISGTRYIEVGKPGGVDATFDIHWLVNGANVIPPAGFEGDIAATGLGSWLFETIGPAFLGEACNVGDELGPKPGSWALWRGRPGFTALETWYTDGGLAVVECRQRSVTRVFGRLYSDLTQNSSGTATAQLEIWFRNTSGSRYPSGWDNVTVYWPLGNSGDSAKNGTFAFADYSTVGTGIWEADPACDPDNTNTSQTGYPANQGWQPFTFSGPPDSGSTQGYGGAGTGTGTF